MLNSIFYKPFFKNFAFLVLRVFTGSLLIHHGFEKLNDINNFADAFVRPLHLPFPVTLSYIAAGSEIGGSWLLILGLATRLGASAILGTMSVAIYHAIITSGFNIYLLELLALYFASAISIILFTYDLLGIALSLIDITTPFPCEIPSVIHVISDIRA